MHHPGPLLVSYPDMVMLADGIPVMPTAGPEQGYKISLSSWLRHDEPDAPDAAQQPE